MRSVKNYHLLFVEKMHIVTLNSKKNLVIVRVQRNGGDMFRVMS